MRTISSRTFVGTLLPPWNCAPFVGAGKIPPYFPPACSSAWEFESNKLEGIVLLLNGTSFVVSAVPFVQPLSACPAGKLSLYGWGDLAGKGGVQLGEGWGDRCKIAAISS